MQAITHDITKWLSSSLTTSIGGPNKNANDNKILISTINPSLSSSFTHQSLCSSLNNFNASHPSAFQCGAPSGTRTPNPPVMSRLLWPIELTVQTRNAVAIGLEGKMSCSKPRSRILLVHMVHELGRASRTRTYNDRVKVCCDNRFHHRSAPELVRQRQVLTFPLPSVNRFLFRSVTTLNKQLSSNPVRTITISNGLVSPIERIHLTLNLCHWTSLLE